MKLVYCLICYIHVNYLGDLLNAKSKIFKTSYPKLKEFFFNLSAVLI